MENSTPDVEPYTTFRERVTAAAVERQAEAGQRVRQASDILGLRQHQRLGEVVEVEVTEGNVLRSFVAEVIARTKDNAEETFWRIGHEGLRSFEAFFTRDTALLALVAIRNGAPDHDGGWAFAARALGVPINPSIESGVRLDRDQIEAWVGHPLTDEQVAELDSAIPNSSIPEAVVAIVDSIAAEADE